VSEQGLNPTKAARMLPASLPGISRQSLSMKEALEADVAMRTGEPAQTGTVIEIDTKAQCAG
jgi:hypothetical protein